MPSPEGDVFDPAVVAEVSRLFEGLAESVPWIASVVAEHLDDYETLLPHLLCGELVHRMAKLDADGHLPVTELRAITNALELALHAVVRRDESDVWRDYLLNLLATAFFEDFELYPTTFRKTRRELGPLLASEYRTYRNALDARSL
jgi:hypothetical protein